MNEIVGKKLVAAVNNTPLPISITNGNETRNFELKQPTLELLIETSGILVEIGINEIKDIFESKDIFKFISNHGNKIIKVIAMILQEKINPSDELIAFIKGGLTPIEMYDVLLNITMRIGVQDFQKSIIGIVPMSLLNQEKIIALIK